MERCIIARFKISVLFNHGLHAGRGDDGRAEVTGGDGREAKMWRWRGKQTAEDTVVVILFSDSLARPKIGRQARELPVGDTVQRIQVHVRWGLVPAII